MADDAGVFDLTGATALVTGCRRGIGRAAALALARAGADIVGVSASLEAGDEVVEEVAGAGRRFTPHRCDLGDRQAVRELVGRLLTDVPRLDILILAAGTIERAPAVDHADDLWDRVLEVNLTAPFVLARELGRRMVVEGRRDNLLVKLHPDVAMYVLEQERELVQRLQKTASFSLELRDDPLLKPDEFKLVVKGQGRDVTQQYAVA